MAEQERLPTQAGDVNQTCADVSKLQNDYYYKPNTSVEKGVEAFIDWYKRYYKIKQWLPTLVEMYEGNSLKNKWKYLKDIL